MGYPVINVEKIKDQLFRLTQTRFLADPSKVGQGKPSPYGYKWDVFVTYRTSDNSNLTESKWMTTQDR